MTDLPTQGAAGETVRRQAQEWWLEAASKVGLDLTGFDPEAPLAQRLAWALEAGLVIATVYTRYSSKQQHSTADQIRACVYYAGQNRMYVPPELISIDEAEKGRRVRRDGLDRLKLILKRGMARVLLVFRVSRLFRLPYLGYQLFQSELVEKGARGISVSQGIDTNDKKVWRTQLQVHGLVDDLQLDAIADHCREGLIGLFKQGCVTGALTVGYRAVEVPGAPPTRRGKPRTMPAVDAKVADLIRQHVTWHLRGMPLMQGLRRWREAGGPADPRSTTGQMSYQAYRRLLSNIRLTGRWEFCRKRNSWSSERDYTRQVLQPDSEVHVYQCQELRILDDEQFLALQEKLKELQTGPRGPRKPKEPKLHDLVTDIFRCPHCQRRFHVCGARGQSMRCPNPDCPTPAMVRRDEAVASLCGKLTELLAQDQDVVERIVAATQRLDARSVDEVDHAAADLERKIRVRSNRINDLIELAGQGSEEDRNELKNKIRSAQAERTALQLELSRLKQSAVAREPLTAEAVRQTLAQFGTLLQDVSQLDAGAAYQAAHVLRQLVGGRVRVEVEARPGRKRGVVRGRFTPRLVTTVVAACGASEVNADAAESEVDVWLRRPPRLEATADEIRRLYEEEGLGFRTIAKRLGIGCGNVYQSYLRYYEMRGLAVPPRRPRGRHRKG